MARDEMNRRSFLKVTGAGVVLLTTGAGTTLAEEEDLRRTAREKVATETGTNVEEIEVVNESTAKWSTIRERYYEAKVYDGTQRETHRVLLDGDGTEVDSAEVDRREAAAYEEQFGKRGRRLANTVEQADADERISVDVWATGIDRAAARKAVGIENAPNNAQTKQQLAEEFRRRTRAKAQGLSSAVRNVTGATVESVGISTPRVEVTATPAAIEQMEQIQGVWRVFERIDEYEPLLDSASRTHDSYSERNGKYDATGYDVGIYEVNGHGKKDSVNLADIYESSHTSDDHAARVSSCSASVDDSHPGMASEADVYGAMTSSSDSDDNKVSWFDSNSVAAMNCSFAADAGTREMQSNDFQYGQYVINNYLNVVVAAGNKSTTDDLIVTSPTKAFNVMSVGAIGDENDGDKSNDNIASFSCYKNPYSKHDDPSSGDYPHSKPEVTAVGGGIAGPNDLLANNKGTSYAAPHVSGLITLLTKFSDDYGTIDFTYYPEVAKPIIMASAIHLGETGDYNFDQWGTGCVNAPAAEKIVQNDWFVSDTFSSSNSNQKYNFYASSSDSEVRLALSWLSDVVNSDFSDNKDAQSDLDLDLYVYDPNGNYVTGSTEWDRSWEWLTFDPSTSGTYEIKVSNYRWDSSDSSRWMGLAWHRS